MREDGENVNEQALAMQDIDDIKCDRPSGPQQSCSNRWIKVAAILGLVLLTVLLVAMIGLHFQQQSEWRKDLAVDAQQISKLADEVTEIKKISQALFFHIGYTSCHGVNLTKAKSRSETGGVFDIVIPGVGLKEVYCNTEVDGGDWIVFQRRMDGSVDFYRNWNEYVAGFGTARGENWLGLEAMYQLTKDGGVEMRIDMIALDRTYYYAKYYAKYSNFQIGPASDNYRLTVSGFSGNATDCMRYDDTEQFTTKDRDNDDATRQCADYLKGAWWYGNCGDCNLNGVYGYQYTEHAYEGVVWYFGSGRYIEMSLTEMKFRKTL